jgi:ectoine hydroxylase-related dioxygenase (phytanoyl-CoA dioxygenase family)
MPVVPSPSEPVEANSELRIVIEPGDLLCFSGAHLHASVPNTSGATRFSVEVRTVSVDDVHAGRGAPNLDGRAPRTAWRWFTGITSNASLASRAEPPTSISKPWGSPTEAWPEDR